MKNSGAGIMLGFLVALFLLISGITVFKLVLAGLCILFSFYCFKAGKKETAKHPSKKATSS